MITGIRPNCHSVNEGESSHRPEINGNSVYHLLWKGLEPGYKCLHFIHGEMHGNLIQGRKRKRVQSKIVCIKNYETQIEFSPEGLSVDGGEDRVSTTSKQQFRLVFFILPQLLPVSSSSTILSLQEVFHVCRRELGVFVRRLQSSTWLQSSPFRIDQSRVTFFV